MIRKLLPLLLLLATGLPGTASGLVMRRLSLDELMDGADRVVLGRVESVESTWSARRRTVLTRIRFSMEKNIKGEGADLTLRLLGGTAKGLRVVMSGMPVLAPGDHLLLFLRMVDGEQDYFLFGMAQGVFRVRPGPDGAPVAVQDSASVFLMSPDEQGALRPVRSLPLRIDLDDPDHASPAGGRP